jgi:hypothetical protein
MRERAESIGGTLVVLSRPGQGTIVKATMPYEVVAAAPAPEAPSIIEDVEPPAERSGILAKIFGR